MSEEEKSKSATKKKKVNKMSALEIEEALKKTEEKMSGLTSKYAQALLARKQELTGSE